MAKIISSRKKYVPDDGFNGEMTEIRIKYTAEKCE